MNRSVTEKLLNLFLVVLFILNTNYFQQGHYLLAVCLDNLGEYGPAITAFLRALRHDQNHQTQLVDNVAVVAANLCHFPDDVLQKLDGNCHYF